MLLCFLISCSSTNTHKPRIAGETQYEKQEEETLRTKLVLQYKMDVYEDKNKRWLLHTGGNVAGDYDHFGNTVKMNAFTTIGIDF